MKAVIAAVSSLLIAGIAANAGTMTIEYYCENLAPTALQMATGFIGSMGEEGDKPLKEILSKADREDMRAVFDASEAAAVAMRAYRKELMQLCAR